ncbi:hypothetical protein P5G50_06925 [Leifsonia sp. F6_8S_P_1B]|uniref:Uncharacterized protein n=1 Tax=Leifsonia williamsii TaxID=3035919 RepID=A0ABT8K9P6_9MICO|nr:hypothetical protein [Leifsonia williamsii]MDN4614184.1 hypothetical protein [Leifsonia williamsii]
MDADDTGTGMVAFRAHERGGPSNWWWSGRRVRSRGRGAAGRGGGRGHHRS